MVRKKKWHTSRRRVCYWSSYHILTSFVIYNWSDTRQNGIFMFYTMNSKVKWGKLQNCLVNDRLFKNLFQFRYFSSRQEHFSYRFLLFLARKQLLLRPSLAQSGIISQTFSKPVRHAGQNKENNFSMTSALRLFNHYSAKARVISLNS